MLEKFCPACGRPFPPELSVSGTVRRRMVDIVSRRPDGVTRDELISLVYAEDPDGGPNCPNIISVLVYHANKQLAVQGYRIKVGWRGKGARYFLEKLNNDADSQRQSA